MRRKPQAKLLGRYIVADPEICHGKPTFRGTRIFVSDVLEMVAEGMAWETIIEQWHNSITTEAIAEAVKLSSAAFLKHADEFVLEPVPAMNILDENVPEDQRSLLQTWGIPIRQIGFDVGRKGMKDEAIIPFLHELRDTTFFTRDLGFYGRKLFTVTIKPLPRLKPLPVLEGFIPGGWEDAIYEFD